MSPQISELLQYDNYVFRNYVFWSGLLIFKTGFMSWMPSIQPLITKFVLRPKAEEAQAQLKDDLARVRSAHRNDLENILPILLVWFLYVLTDPNPDVAVNLMRVTVAFRLWHTLVYAIYPIRQPARGIGFLVPWVIMMYMSVMVMVVFVG